MALGLLIEHRNLIHRPQPVFDPRRHRRRHPKRLVDADEVVPDGIERDHVSVVFDLLAKGIGEAGEAAHVHPHREVRALGVAG